jgi:hypothetical protein
MNYVQQVKRGGYFFGMLFGGYYLFKHCIYYGKFFALKSQWSRVTVHSSLAS